MRRSAVVRVITLALAFVHTFPARTHLAAFAASPSWGDAWKGFGAIAAIGIYLLPPAVQSRGLAFLWRRHRSVLRTAAVALAVAHLVPALDHVPGFLRAPSWADAWRALGTTFAIAWFLAPLRLQASVILFLGGVLRRPWVPPSRSVHSLRRVARQP